MLRGVGWEAFNELTRRRTATVFSERSRLLEPLLPAGKAFGIPVICYFWYFGTVCEHSEGDDLPCCGVCWGTACLKCLVSLEAGKHLMKSLQVAGESDPRCRAEPSWYSPRAVPWPAAQGQ